jgi:hypothetical protein
MGQGIMHMSMPQSLQKGTCWHTWPQMPPKAPATNLCASDISWSFSPYMCRLNASAHAMRMPASGMTFAQLIPLPLQKAITVPAC